MVRVLLALGMVVVLSAPSPSPDSGVPEELRRTVQELREAEGGQAVRVAVQGQVELSPGNVREGVRQIVGAREGRSLVVDLTASPRSGQAGALLALLALLGLVALAVFTTRRPVATATTGRPLPPGFLLSGAPKPADRPAPALTGRPRLAVVRRSSSDGPVRTAVVRTCLRPQGYVEFDGWLHRATWAEPSLTPPGPGARVDVVGPESGRLEAFAPGGPGHVDGRARGSMPP